MVPGSEMIQFTVRKLFLRWRWTVQEAQMPKETPFEDVLQQAHL